MVQKQESHFGEALLRHTLETKIRSGLLIVFFNALVAAIHSHLYAKSYDSRPTYDVPKMRAQGDSAFPLGYHLLAGAVWLVFLSFATTRHRLTGGQK